MHIYRTHCKGRSRVDRKNSVILVSERTDLAYRIEKTGSGFVVCCMNEGDLGMLGESFFDCVKVGRAVKRKAKVNVIQAVMLANFNGAGAVCAVIYDENLAAFRKQGIYANVYVDCARTAEEHRCVFVGICVNDLQKVGSHFCHHGSKFFFARTNIGNELRRLYGIGCCGGTGV